MYHFIVNPASCSGRGQQYWERIQPVLAEKKAAYKVYFSKRTGNTIELVQKLCAECTEEALHIIILGGDGTVNEAIQGIDDFKKVIISYIPTGSSNDLARDLGISRVPEEALESILHQNTDLYIDLGLLHYEKAFYQGKEVSPPDRRFIIGCGIGFDAAVCEEAMNNSRIKDILNRLGLGKLTYLGIALKQLIQARFITGSITFDGKETIPLKRTFLIVGMVHRYQGGGFMFCPNAKDDDGLLDFCVASNVSKWRVLRVLPTVFKGKHLRFKEIDEYKAKEAVIELAMPLWVQTDGEVTAKASRIHLKNMEERVHFIY